MAITTYVEAPMPWLIYVGHLTTSAAVPISRLKTRF